MIASIRGTLQEALPTQVVVETHGIGYEVLIPLSSFERLPPVGNEVRLLTHLVVREDAHVLYGFTSAAERELFRLLIGTVTGVGPKLALNILSGMNPTAFRSAVAGGDLRALSGVSGVGRRTAERIILELKDKLGKGAALEVTSPIHPRNTAEQAVHDAVLALVELGYKQPEVLSIVRSTQAVLGVQATVEELIRASLKKGLR